MTADAENLILDDEVIDNIKKAIRKIQFERFLAETKIFADTLESLHIDPKTLFELSYNQKLEEKIKEIDLRLREIGSELELSLTEEERLYLAGILYLKNDLQVYPIISSFVYELLRSAGLIDDSNKRRRALIATKILDSLTDKGLINKITIDNDIPQKFSPRISYVYMLNNGKFVSEIQKFICYNTMKSKSKTIQDDTRFKKLLKNYKDTTDIIAEKLL